MSAGRGTDDPTKCVERVANGNRSFGFHQCTRGRGHGPDGRYCRQHDPARVQRRHAAEAEVREERVRRDKAIQREGRDLARRLGVAAETRWFYGGTPRASGYTRHLVISFEDVEAVIATLQKGGDA